MNIQVFFQVKVAVLKMKNDSAAENDMENLISSSESVLGEWLDKLKGHEVTDNSIFSHLPRHYENEFNKDMDALNVRFFTRYIMYFSLIIVDLFLSRLCFSLLHC